VRCKNASFIIAYRCAATGKTGDFTSLALPDSVPFLHDKLVSAARNGADEVLALCGEYGIDVGEGSGAMSILAGARAAENEYMARSAYVSMGAAPIVSYYLRAEAEISFIRELLSCKRCGFTEENIRERVGGAF